MKFPLILSDLSIYFTSEIIRLYIKNSQGFDVGYRVFKKIISSIILSRIDKVTFS